MQDTAGEAKTNSWIPSHGSASVGWPTRTYLQQHCMDTRYRLEDPPETMDGSDERWERVREIHDGIATGWWGCSKQNSGKKLHAVSCRIWWLHLCRGVRLLPLTISVLDMTLNYIWGWGFSSEALGNVECPPRCHYSQVHFVPKF